MKVSLALHLAMLSAFAIAEEEWVSVGATQVVAPASSQKKATHEKRPHFAGKPLSGNSELLSELMSQIEYMQRDNAQLRSIVEQQEQQIQLMQQQQQERYLDLDRRLSALMKMPTVTGSSPAPDVVKKSSSDAYKAARDLIKQNKLADANKAFNDFIRLYPNDPLLANAHYWNGEVYLVQGNYEDAHHEFRLVIDQHPDHLKAADASYKMGVILHKQKKVAAARRWLKKVIEQYKEKSSATASLAQSYLDSMASSAP